MFETGKHHESTTCVDCGKDRECLEVRCKAGTFDGPLCAKCLYKEARKRSRNGKGEQTMFVQS